MKSPVLMALLSNVNVGACWSMLFFSIHDLFDPFALATHDEQR